MPQAQTFIFDLIGVLHLASGSHAVTRWFSRAAERAISSYTNPNHTFAQFIYEDHGPEYGGPLAS